ncbi:MAG: hypothetical protein M3415_05405 [Actinomycetota bacterium]|nr:hypothetical protein [Actinomycetota bacterium]
MRMRVPAVLLGALLLAVPATPAAAGGYSSVDFGSGRRHLAPGERVQVRVGGLLWPTVAAARRAISSSEFGVYLQPGPGEYAGDPQRAWRGPAEGAVRMRGKVRLRQGRPGANIVEASARVTIPELRPGRYHAVLCTSGCRRLAPDLWPTDVTVVPSAIEARVADRFDRDWQRTQGALWRVEDRLARRMVNAGTVRVNTDSALRSDVDEAHDEVGRLGAALERLTTDRDRDLAVVRRLGSAAAAVGLVLLALCAWLSWALWRARRQPSAPGVPDESWERPSERHLVGSRREAR